MIEKARARGIYSDLQVADLLLSASRGASLLGAQVLLTGLRPDVARTLVDLGSDLSNLSPFATLRQGVAHALGCLEKRNTRPGNSRRNRPLP